MQHQRLFIVVAAYVLAASWFAEPARAGVEVDLHPQFEPGQVTHYKSTSTIVHRPSGVDPAIAGDSGGETTMHTEAGMTLHVVELTADEGAVIEWTLQYMTIRSTDKIAGIPGLLDYDSREPDASNSPMAPMFNALVKRPVRITVDATGKVLRYEGVDATGVPGTLGQLMGGFFSPEMFEQLPFFVTANAPVPAKKRSRWSQRTAVQMPHGVGSFDLKNEYTVRRAFKSKGLAKISVVGVVSKGVPSGLTGVPAPADTWVIHRSGVEGELQWDIKAGQLLSAESQMWLDMSMDTLLGRMNVKQDIHSTVLRTKRTTAPKPPEESARPAKPEFRSENSEE